MLWEFRQFWPRLRDGGLLMSHDVQMNSAFPEFIASTYAHDKKPDAAMRSARRIMNGAAGLHRVRRLRKPTTNVRVIDLISRQTRASPRPGIGRRCGGIFAVRGHLRPGVRQLQVGMQSLSLFLRLIG